MVLNDPKSFTIDVKGSVTNQDYKGLFRVKPLLSHRDRLRMDELKRQLLGSQLDSASPSALQISSIFSKIWVHLQDAPSWWKDAGNGVDLLDEEPVVEVLEKIASLEKESAAELTKTAEKAKAELVEMAKKQE